MSSTLPKMYKAIQCGRPGGKWEIVMKQLRDPDLFEILIRVHASGICNSDHFVMDGSWPGIQYPRIPGHEVIGRIVQVGKGISNNAAHTTRYAIGSLVGVGWNGGYCGQCSHCRKGDFWCCDLIEYSGITVDGGHGEYVYASQSAVISIAEDALKGASYSELAPLFCAGATVFAAILSSKWSPGDICVVQGVGGLGHLAIQFASKLGMKVYAVSSSSAKRELALSLGAHNFIDSSKEDTVTRCQNAGGANLIICTAPSSRAISEILPAVTKSGEIILVSAAADGPIQVDNILMNMNRATLRGFACGSAQDAEGCVKYAAMSNIKAIVQEFPLERFPEAYENVMQNTANIRNVIVFP